MSIDQIAWLQNWFSDQSNGIWEHSFGIKIETLDNPGWKVIIDIDQTALAEKPFNTINVEKNEMDWIVCRIQDLRFEGYCGPQNLGKLLRIFHDWAES